MAEPGRPSARRAARGAGLRRFCLAAIVLLYVASVPWYRAPDQPFRLWLGMPDWVSVALLCYVAVAVLNAFAWLSTEIPEDLAAPPEPAESDDHEERPE